MEAFFSRTVTLGGALSAATGEPNDGVDRISALPDDIRGKIVSHLPVKDAVRTTLLSTRWLRVWHSTPLVLYDSLHSYPGPDEPARVAAVDRVLTRHPGPFHTVHLALHECEHHQWSRLLAAEGVSNLALVGISEGMGRLRLPVRLLLHCWNFPDTIDLPNRTGVFFHLRELTMVNNFFEDRDLIDHILASSPVLETFVLDFNWGNAKHVRLRGQRLQCMLFLESMAFDDLEVVDSPLLKHLIMWKTCPC